MSDADEDAVPTEGLPESLLEAVDSLTRSELEALLSYVEKRLEADWSSLRADIEASAAGEVIDVERDGPYALVRAHPPESGVGGDTDDAAGDSKAVDGDADDAGGDAEAVAVDTDVVSLYHVRPEYPADGADSLHWAYLGDVYDTGRHRCTACGRSLDETDTVCPHCGSDESHDPETEP